VGRVGGEHRQRAPGAGRAPREPLPHARPLPCQQPQREQQDAQQLQPQVGRPERA